MRMTTLATGPLALAILTTTLLAQAGANEPGVTLPADAFDRVFAPPHMDLGGTDVEHSSSPPVDRAVAGTDVESQGAVEASLEDRPLPSIEGRALGVMPEQGTSGAGVTDAEGWIRTGLALGAVIGLLMVLRHLLVRAGRRAGVAGALGAGGRAPSGVLTVLGRYPIARGRSLVLLQLDTRVMLLDQSADGFRTLSEITDEREVASILMKTRDEEGASQAARFNEMLRDLERDPRTLDDAYTTDELARRVRRMREMD
ncbi:MAG: hypothetical protein Tsb0013_16220 [Phycisphaerales bacterium]